MVAIWLLLSFEQILKMLGLRRGAMFCAVFLALAGAALGWIQRRERGKQREQDSRLVAAALALEWLFAACAYFVLHPLSQKHVFGPGSDRENAIEVACRAFLSGDFPYAHLTFLHHPITPMPGALLLAAPFYLAGHIGVQNLAWLGVFLIWCYRIFDRTWWAAWFAFVFIVGNPCVMQDLVTGGDFFTNFAYVVILLTCLVRSLAQAPRSAGGWVWPLLLGVALSSRPIYSIVYPCLLALAWQVAGRVVAVRTVLLTALAQLGVTLPVYLRDPSHFTPFNVGSNAYALIPSGLHPAIAMLTLGLAIASTAFFVRVDLRRMLTILGIALTAVTLPLFIVDRMFRPELFPLINLIYLSPGLFLLVTGAIQWLRPLALPVESAG